MNSIVYCQSSYLLDSIPFFLLTALLSIAHLQRQLISPPTPTVHLPSFLGSGEGHTVYFYKRLNPLCIPKAKSLMVKSRIILMNFLICRLTMIYSVHLELMLTPLSILLNDSIIFSSSL